MIFANLGSFCLQLRRSRQSSTWSDWNFSALFHVWREFVFARWTWQQVQLLYVLSWFAETWSSQVFWKTNQLSLQASLHSAITSVPRWRSSQTSAETSLLRHDHVRLLLKLPCSDAIKSRVLNHEVIFCLDNGVSFYHGWNVLFLVLITYGRWAGIVGDDRTRVHKPKGRRLSPTGQMRNFFKTAVKNFFLPTRLDYARSFGWGWRILIVILFLSLIILCLPPMVGLISTSVLSLEFKHYLITNKDILKAWLNFGSLVLEILIAILLGQILLTEGMAQRLKRLVADSQVNYQRNLEIELRTEEMQLKNNVDEIYRLLHENASFPKLIANIGKAYRLVKESLIFLYPGLRDLYTKVIFLSLITSFPGGLYGLGAFILFILLSFTKVLGFFLDNPAFTKWLCSGLLRIHRLSNPWVMARGWESKAVADQIE